VLHNVCDAMRHVAIRNPYRALPDGRRGWGGGGSTDVTSALFVTCCVDRDGVRKCRKLTGHATQRNKAAVHSSPIARRRIT
jgi:hypothetical protein